MLLRKKTLLAMLVGGAGLGAASLAFGHGAMIDPPARQTVCNIKGYPIQGMCLEAINKGSGGLSDPIDTWHEFVGTALGDHGVEEAKKDVKDGYLCSGSKRGFGFNIPSDQWETTVLKPDAHGKVKMRYGYTRGHEGSFNEFYITKKGFDVTKNVIGWNDVELLATVEAATNKVTVSGLKPAQVQEIEDYNIEIPADRTGRAVIFTRWQRIDPAGEGFYNCSDVVITERGSNVIPPVDTPEEVQPPVSIGWVEKAKFVDHQAPKAGDKVIFRLMGGDEGSDLIKISKTITSSNTGDKWISELAAEINRDHSNMVLIGQKGQSGSIMFNEQQPRGNGIFLNNGDYSAVLTVEKAANTPYASIGGDFEVVSPANGQATYKLDGSNSKNAVSYSWKVVGGADKFSLQERNGGTLASSSNSAVVSAVIPANSEGTAIYELTVKSSNGKTHSNRVTITVRANDAQPVVEESKPVVEKSKPAVNNETVNNVSSPAVDAWKTGVNYKINDVVEYKGIKYRCRQSHPSMAHWNPADVLALWEPVK